MIDHLSPDRRGRLMARVKGRDTSPEMIVRRLAHRLGYRFRLHRRDLPGTPDLVFVAQRKVIFVHGCFWHQHDGCRRATRPKTNVEFWEAKLAKNVDRDAEVQKEISASGWEILVVWECETRDEKRLEVTLLTFLNGNGMSNTPHSPSGRSHG